MNAKETDSLSRSPGILSEFRKLQTMAMLFASSVAAFVGCNSPEKEKVATPVAETKLSEQEIAANILTLGGRLEVFVEGERQTLKAGDRLPQDSFLVASCVLNKEFKSRDIVMLKDLKRLEKLDLELSGLKDEDLSILEDLPTLEYLKVGFLDKSFSLTDQGLRTIAECKNLKKIGIGNAPEITGRGLSHIAANQSIRSVTIYSNPHLTGEDFRQLTKSGELNEVKLLHQPERPLPASKIDALSGVPELYFHDCKLNDDSIDALCRLPKLKKAYFSYCTITLAQEEKLRTKLKGVDLWVDERRPKF